MKWKRSLLVGIVSLLLATTAFAQQSLLDEADAALAAREYQAAITAYTRYLGEVPDSAAALVGRARALAATGDVQLAEQDVRKAFILSPQNPQAYLARAIISIVAGDFVAADEDLAAGLRLDADNAEIYYYRGVLQEFEGELAEAVRSYSRAIELEPTTEYYLSRALLHNFNGDLESALEDYDSALTLALDDGERANVFYERAQVHIDAGDRDAGIADMTRAIELVPDWASAYLSRGFYYWEAGDTDNAAPDYYQWVTLLETQRFEEEALADGDTVMVEMEEGWIYAYPLSADKPLLLTVDAYSPSGTVDPVVIILDADGTPITVDDDSGGFLGVLLEDYALPGIGDYTILLSHAGGGSFGSVSLSIQLRPNIGNA